MGEVTYYDLELLSCHELTTQEGGNGQTQTPTARCRKPHNSFDTVDLHAENFQVFGIVNNVVHWQARFLQLDFRRAPGLAANSRASANEELVVDVNKRGG